MRDLRMSPDYRITRLMGVDILASSCNNHVMKYIDMKYRSPKKKTDNFRYTVLGMLLGALLAINWGLAKLNNQLQRQITETEKIKLELQLQNQILDKQLQELETIRKFEEKVAYLSAPFEAYGNMDYTKMVAKKFLTEFDEETAKTALLIVARESGFNPQAENTTNSDGSNDKGCWQINSIHNIDDDKRLDCEWSTDWAILKVKNDGGFYAWSGYWNLKAEGRI